MKKLIVMLALLPLVGCSSDESQVLLADPITGCQYIATYYGGGGPMSGSYIKPRTDRAGKQVCAK